MKKLTRLTAILLTGALLLVLTACEAAPNLVGPEAEKRAKEEILNAIYELRTEEKLPEFVEVKALSAVEQDWINAFRDAPNNELSVSDIAKNLNEIYEKREAVAPHWNRYGVTCGIRSSGVAWSLCYPTYDGNIDALRPMLKAEFASGQFASGQYKDSIYGIALAATTINGKIYWVCTLFAPKT